MIGPNEAREGETGQKGLGRRRWDGFFSMRLSAMALGLDSMIGFDERKT